MPWTGSGGFDFTVPSVQANAPAASGVYVLYTGADNIYVGESGNIRDRLVQHLRRRSQRPFRPPEGVTYYEQLQKMGLLYL